MATPKQRQEQGCRAGRKAPLEQRLTQRDQDRRAHRERLAAGLRNWGE